VKREARIGTIASIGALAVLVAGEGTASAVETTEHHYETEGNDYGRKGVIELGGSFGWSWNKDIWDLDLTPSIGYFIADRVELSLLVGIEYVNTKLPDGSRVHTSEGSILFEPSYHLPISDTLLVFGGLGAGVAYNGSHPAFDVEPRLGLNVDVGRAGVFSPAFVVPILIGNGQGGTADDPSNVLVGLEFQAGFTTTF
jgi:hypothetical protein